MPTTVGFQLGKCENAWDGLSSILIRTLSWTWMTLIRRLVYLGYQSTKYCTWGLVHPQQLTHFETLRICCKWNRSICHEGLQAEWREKSWGVKWGVQVACIDASLKEEVCRQSTRPQKFRYTSILARTLLGHILVASMFIKMLLSYLGRKASYLFIRGSLPINTVKTLCISSAFVLRCPAGTKSRNSRREQPRW